MARKKHRTKVFRKDEPTQPSHVYAERIADRFNLTITSGYRTAAENARVGGVPNSYHVRGLAQDYVGRLINKARAWAWGKVNRKFAEVLIHNVGSGIHLHLAFKEGKAKASRRKY